MSGRRAALPPVGNGGSQIEEPSVAVRVRSSVMDVFRTAFQDRDRGNEAPAADLDQRRPIVGRKSTVAGVVSDGELLQSVCRDLGTLLNAVNFAGGTDLTAFPQVRSSILNFGFPDLAHRSIDKGTITQIGAELAAALSMFEPRLARDSIRCICDERVEADMLRIRFIVSADLDCDPLNVPVTFFADLERDTGKILVQRR